MAIYTGSKTGIGAVYPENAIDAELSRLEPILTPAQVRNRHLFGLPLVSQMKDPITGKAAVMTDEIIQDVIMGAISQVETNCRIDISPVKRREKFPFDRNLYEAYGYMKLPHRPVTSVDKLSITPANAQDIYVVPVEWIEAAYLARGQVNIIPMTAAFVFGGTVPTSSTGGAFFLAILGNKWWIPAYWQAEYTSGYPDGMVPRIVNELIGTIVAQEILSQLAATFGKSQGHSLGIDGMSQSVSSPGPQVFTTRIQDLEAKKDNLVRKIRNMYGTGFFSTNA